MSVSSQDVERVAELANLELTESERATMVRDLNSVLNYFGELGELDTSAVAPMIQVTGTADETKSELRPDSLVPSLDRKTVLEEAPDTDGAFFRVPKVIER